MTRTDGDRECAPDRNSLRRKGVLRFSLRFVRSGVSLLSIAHSSRRSAGGGRRRQRASRRRSASNRRAWRQIRHRSSERPRAMPAGAASRAAARQPCDSAARAS
ncbi:hypothetical protein WS62_05275 [Burkholderia sp. ABCPW 14]|nr:hypothetical protein WS62_05275 [Burkholderia sp. ABCPW 14]